MHFTYAAVKYCVRAASGAAPHNGCTSALRTTTGAVGPPGRRAADKSADRPSSCRSSSAWASSDYKAPSRNGLLIRVEQANRAMLARTSACRPQVWPLGSPAGPWGTGDELAASTSWPFWSSHATATWFEPSSNPVSPTMWLACTQPRAGQTLAQRAADPPRPPRSAPPTLPRSTSIDPHKRSPVPRILSLQGKSVSLLLKPPSSPSRTAMFPAPFLRQWTSTQGQIKRMPSDKFDLPLKGQVSALRAQPPVTFL